jgi:lysophospholipase L1-like esterase
MTLLTIITSVTVGVLAAFVRLVYLAFRRKPVNNPQHFLQKNHQSTRQKVVIMGDSQTHATLSSDYLAMLRSELIGQAIEIINAGRNGDTSRGVWQRLERDALACQPDRIVIYIGTNEAIRNTHLAARLAAYQHNLSQIIQKIKAWKDIPVALIAFPPLGENVNSLKNQEVDQFNQIQQALARQFSITYIPFNESLKEVLRQKDNKDDAEFSMPLSRLFNAAFKKYYLGQGYNQIAKANGLQILSDGIHLNDTSGQILASGLKRWITSE